MTNVELINKVDELKEIEALIEQATIQANTIKDELKAEMIERDTEDLDLGEAIIRYTSVLSTRFDTKRFKETFGEELYKAYTKEVASRRFAVA